MLLIGLPLIQIAVLSQLSHAPAAQERGSWVAAPTELVTAKLTSGSRILFLNRCVGDCFVEPGFEDSRTNHSSIIPRPIQLSEWIHTDEQWDEMVSCVRDLYAPFDVVVTDVDPGMTSHFEAIVAGTSQEGTFSRAGGVSPFTCGVIENAITYTYASIYSDMRKICNVVGQESAHALGLDHEMECNDPLTYLPGCPTKSFQDIDAPCGEFANRDCACGGETQNSVQYLNDLFGEGSVPDVSITSPAAGTDVVTGFRITASGVDDHETLLLGQLWIDGQHISSKEEPPYTFSAPTNLSPGPHEIEVRIYDDRDQFGSTSITVTQSPCESDNVCDSSYLCLAGQCVLEPGAAGGLGDTCNDPTDCDGDLCAAEAGSDAVCTAFCQLDPNACPENFECVSAADQRMICMPNRSEPGGCNTTGRQSGTYWFAAILLLLCGTRKHGKRRNSASKS